MRHSDVTAGQRASGRTVQSPPVFFARQFGFDQFIHGHDVIFNLSEQAGYWAHMMRKGRQQLPFWNKESIVNVFAPIDLL